tara:strand:+ start:376 stop:498 length:123 start_codon:yes stop_codon:yes gene_type:complete
MSSREQAEAEAEANEFMALLQVLGRLFGNRSPLPFGTSDL